jgi:excisionase family DNA binding protein
MQASTSSPRNVTIQASSIRDICANLGVSKGFIIGQIKRGKLRARRLGRRVIVLEEDLRKYLEQS